MALQKIQRLKSPIITDLDQIPREEITEPEPNDEDLGSENDLSENITPEAFLDLINELTSNQEQQADYNSLADGFIYKNQGAELDLDQVRALKNQNRNRALDNREKIKSYRKVFLSNMSEDHAGVSLSLAEHERLASFIDSTFNSPVLTSLIYGAFLEIHERLVGDGQIEFDVSTESVVRDLDLSEFGGPSNFGATESADLELIIQGIDLFEDHISVVPASGVTFPTAYALGYRSIRDAEAANESVIETLGGIDENTNYIESLFGLDTDSVNFDIGDRPARFSLAEIWENCFDCFADVWNGDVDFKFNIDIELRLKAFLDTIEDLLGSIAYAINLPAIIMSNACSLLKIGTLCPIEIAFLISSLVALTRFTVTEVVLNISGVMKELVSAILKPLLGALELTSNLTVAPFKGYVGCVQRTFLTQSQSNWTGSFSRAQMHEVLNGRSLIGVPEADIHAFLEKAKDIDPQLLNAILLQPVSLGSDDLLRWIGDPNLRQYMDPVEYFSMALMESSQKLTQAHAWIQNTLAGLEAFIKENSISRIELTAKIIALSTLISVLISVGLRLANHDTVCEVVENEDGSSETVVNVPLDQFFEGFNMPNVWDLSSLYRDEPIDNGIIEDSPSANLRNTITNEQIPFASCGKVSDVNLRSILDSIGVSNV